ncbi:sterol O-acyltransferase 1-like [Artemia franciscana]|uniref:O-acyltransferase n=1 Tax=Artemia franciscana TaxID=6661 RepID=A0AA88LJF2_ARTSF|nr:hypothetical protein QYM36_000465 [Artemia franciscana]
MMLLPSKDNSEGMKADNTCLSQVEMAHIHQVDRIPENYDADCKNGSISSKARSNSSTSEKEVKINLVKMKKELEELQQKLVSNLNWKMAEMVDHFVSEIEEVELPRNLRVFVNDNKPKRRNNSGNGGLPEKKFCHRNSLLTDMLEINHIQTIYHIFAAILVVLLLNTVVCDIFDKGTVDYDFKLIQWSFGQPKTVLFIWTGMMFTTSVFVYISFHFWAHTRATLKSDMQMKIWDITSILVFIIYICLFFYVPVHEVLLHQLAPASAVIIIDEQVRMLMKTYAFVRENAPTAVKYSKITRQGGTPSDLKRFAKEEGIDGPCPDFGKYLYFLFAPTLIYRHRYPRTPSTSWSKVFSYFAQVVGMIIYMYFIFVRFCVPVFRKFGQEPFTCKGIILSVFGCMMPGTLVLVITFYCVLHVWLNGFAEMLRFGDRMFYEDWWNSSSYSRYYRTWNVVVHDWLYTYIYKDIYDLTGRKNKVLPKLAVFVISSLVHEYIMGFTMRFFYPIIFVLFGGFGVAFAFLNNMGVRVGNVFLWATLFMGTGLLMSIYSMEFYARINCPPPEGYLLSWLPRSWTCNAIH